MRIVAIEPFYSGSHRSVLDGLARSSRFEVIKLTLPGRLWKWRMRTAAFDLAEAFNDLPGKIDCLFASDFLDLATFMAFQKRQERFATVAYFHENQITYPAVGKKKQDLHFAFTNLTTVHAADAVWFNSMWHQNDFIQGTKKLLKRAPEGQKLGWIDKNLHKFDVVYLGIDPPTEQRMSVSEKAPIILWNHRWEFDKDPEGFFRILTEVKHRGGRFRLSICGESFRRVPGVFHKLKKEFSREILHFGYCDDRSKYQKLLNQADIVMSTAKHEFFGISVVEAISSGCFPLLPNRLSYPEILPAAWHQDCLYEDERGCVEKLLYLLATPHIFRKHDCSEVTSCFNWKKRIDAFDDGFLKVVEQCGPGRSILEPL